MFLKATFCTYSVFTYFYAPATKSLGGGHINLPTFVRPDIDTWFVQLSPPTVLELQL